VSPEAHLHVVPESPLEGPERRVRPATHADVREIAAGVGELLAELGGTPPPAERLQETARALIDDPDAGALLVAECDNQVVGVLGASWQTAIRTTGRYGLIQELWVMRSYRHKQIGAELLTALCELARSIGVARLEVGLPSERFAQLTATESFYANNDFVGIGLRMRRLL